MITWTLTPAGDGERTLVRVEAMVRDPAFDGRFVRARACRALQRIHAQLLERLDAELGRAGVGSDRRRTIGYKSGVRVRLLFL